jgi:SAM-dependent methyltransferase
MRYFNQKNHRLIYFDQQASPDFWDKHWSVDCSIREKIMGTKDTWVTKVTRKYLKPEKGTILEGGCGLALHVAALVHNGYSCIGVDVAPETIRTIHKAVPELDVHLGDVRHLGFRDASFAGYWSLGVIEHFWEGYEAVGLEMARVLKPGGYLFLTFPYMSPLRKLKASLGRYPKWKASQTPASFYQFALDHRTVIRNFTQWGFDFVAVRPFDGLKGTKSEITILHRVFQKLYDYKGTSLFIRVSRALLSKALSLVAGHSILLIFNRKTL